MLWPCRKAGMLLLIVLFWIVNAGQTQPASQKGFVLFTPQEAEPLRLTAEEWRPPPRKRALPTGPRIVVQRPQVMDSSAGSVIETISPMDFFVFFEVHHAPVDWSPPGHRKKRAVFSVSHRPAQTIHPGNESPSKRVDNPSGAVPDPERDC